MNCLSPRGAVSWDLKELSEQVELELILDNCEVHPAGTIKETSWGRILFGTQILHDAGAERILQKSGVTK